MPGKSYDLSVIVGLVDKLSAPLKGIGARLRKTGAEFSMIGQGASQASQKIIGPLKDILMESIAVESAMADIQKVADFKGTGLADMQAELETLTETIPLTLVELAAITAEGAQSNVAKPDLAGFTATVAQAAVAFDMLPAAAGEAFAKLANIYDRPIKKISELGDAINYLSNNDAAKAAQIIETTQRIGGTARPFGLLDTQAAALSGSFIALALEPDRAATAINKLLTTMQAAGKEGPRVQAALKGIGTNAAKLKKAIGEDASGALTDFLERLEQIDQQDRSGVLIDLFGRESADEISTLVGSLDKYRESLARVSDPSQYAGSTASEAAVRAKTTGNQLKILINRVNSLKRSIGDSLLPVIKEILVAIKPYIDKLKVWVGENKELTRTIALVAAALGAFMLIFGPLAMTLSSIFGLIAMISGPIGILLGLLALATAAFVYWDEVITAVSDSFEVLVEMMGFDPVAVIAEKWGRLSDYFSAVWTEITAGAEQGFGPALLAVMSRLNPISMMIDITSALAPEAVQAMAEVAQRLLDQLTTILSKDALWAIGKDLMSGLAEGIKSAASWAWDAATAAARGVVNAVTGATETHSPSRVFADIGGDLIAGLVQGIDRAAGQPVTSMNRIAAGLIAAPLALGAPAAVGAQAGGGAGGGMQVELNITAPAGSDAQDLADIVVRELEHMQRRSAPLYDRSDDL